MGEAVDLIRPEDRRRLPRVLAASGVRYAAGGTSVWNKGLGAPPQQDGSLRGDTVYDAITDAHRLIVSIRASPCVDTMSGDRHSLTVDIQLDGRAYRGCGDALAP